MEDSFYVGSHAHHGETVDDGRVTDPVEEETRRLAVRSDDESGDGGAYQPRAVKQRGLQGDGVTEVLFVVQHFH